jgi:hypothetical protein
MGHTYRNIIDATGGSGSPQMRYGGLIKNSLIIEGYWYSSTSSYDKDTPWVIGQSGRSAVVRNNVQFTYNYPSPNDPDTDGTSDVRAHYGGGYMLASASFGALIENNIISGALMANDLGFGEHLGRYAFNLRPGPRKYEDGTVYTMQQNTLRNNIGYRLNAGLSINSDWAGTEGNVAEDNVFVANDAVGTRKVKDLESADQLHLRDNRFYVNNEDLPDGKWVGTGNTLASYNEAAERENWPDPDRTLKRYVREELGLTLLDWSDDPWLPEEEVAPRVEAGEAYDPMGLKTFMAVATNMRRGGTDRIPASGKPSWTGDYPWDARFTGVAVVNWIREGFGREPVQSEMD